MSRIEELQACRVMIVLQPLSDDEKFVLGWTHTFPESREVIIGMLMRPVWEHQTGIDEATARVWVAKGLLRLKARGMVQHVGDDYWLSNYSAESFHERL
jgi:hypothetical protein